MNELYINFNSQSSFLSFNFLRVCCGLSYIGVVGGEMVVRLPQLNLN